MDYKKTSIVNSINWKLSKCHHLDMLLRTAMTRFALLKQNLSQEKNQCNSYKKLLPFEVPSIASPVASTSNSNKRGMSDNPGHEVLYLEETISVDPSKKVHSENQENDITYLYTVDSSPAGCVVEEIDLSLESQKSDTAVVAENSFQTSKENASSLKNQNSRKRKSKVNEGNRKSKRIKDRDHQCSVCYVHYDSLVKDAQNMLISNCGHIYCQHCAQQFRGKKCKSCGQMINKLCKIFF